MALLAIHSCISVFLLLSYWISYRQLDETAIVPFNARNSTSLCQVAQRSSRFPYTRFSRLVLKATQRLEKSSMIAQENCDRVSKGDRDDVQHSPVVVMPNKSDAARSIYPHRATPLPRISIRHNGQSPAEFYLEDTKESFIPLGFNYTVLENGDSGWHATFNVGTYCSDTMDTTLKKMSAVGANCIRVWAWGVQKETGFTGVPSHTGLNREYMDNFIDFLRKATFYGIYVIAILDEVPHNAYYDRIAAEADEKTAIGAVPVTGYNRNYLCAGPLAAKSAAAQDFVQYIKEVDPSLLNTILGWSFANELFVNYSEGPFQSSSGEVVLPTIGRRYNMADPLARQACYDDAVLHWTNTLVNSVKSVDPHALTTVGMWTSDAHGRPPVNYLLPDGKDIRIPPRPSVLASSESMLDFLDIHIYPWDGTPNVNADAHEINYTSKGIKLVVVGEYGVFKDKSVDQAKCMMREMLNQAKVLGYKGALHWSWDLTQVPGQTWSAVECGLGEYLMALDIFK